jgi:hypothetical protein
MANPNKEMALRYWSDPDYYVAQWYNAVSEQWVTDKHPSFKQNVAWRVSLATVEGKPVFSGDKGWCKLTNEEIIVEDGFIRLWLERNFIWNLPKRTVVVNGTELPLPDGCFQDFPIKIPFYFRSFADAQKWSDKISSLLCGEE